jgi:hypothetical protein
MSLSDELRKTCMQCWMEAGWCRPAPTMMWGENCEHLVEVGKDIKRKLAKQRQFLKEEGK